MHHEKPKQEVKTLSIRIPLDLYFIISQYALDKDISSLNAAIIELVQAGVELTTEKDNIIGQFILEFVGQEKLEEIINGK